MRPVSGRPGSDFVFAVAALAIRHRRRRTAAGRDSVPPLARTLTRCIAISLCLSALARPAASVFPTIVQTVCDPDFPGCVSGVSGLDGARGLALSPDDKHVYVCSGLDDALLAFARNTVDGTIAHVQTIFDTDPGINGLDACRGVAVSPDGKHVYTAGLLDDALAVWSRNAATGALTLVEVELDNSGGVDGLDGATSAAVSPDGKHVYVAGRSDDAVAVFSRDATTGQVTFLQAMFDGAGGVDGLDAAEQVRLSPDGRHLYVASENDNAVAVFTRDHASPSANFGKLTFLEVKKDGVAGVDGLNDAGRLALDPLGQNVYVGGERTIGGGDWAAVFRRNTDPLSPDFGKLTFLQALKEETFGPYTGCNGIGPEESGVVVSPNGLFVFLGNSFRSTVATFSRSATDGTLTFVDSICDTDFTSRLIAVNGLAVSADGRNTYWTAGAGSSVGVFDSKCESPNIDLVLTAQDIGSAKTETACRSIAASDYTVLEAGIVTFQAPTIALGDDFEVRGEFTAVIMVP